MKEQKVAIRTEFIKLEQLLKFAGLCMTGGEAKEIILAGKVLVNGEPENRRGRKIRPGDKVECSGTLLTVTAG